MKWNTENRQTPAKNINHVAARLVKITLIALYKYYYVGESCYSTVGNGCQCICYYL